MLSEIRSRRDRPSPTSYTEEDVRSRLRAAVGYAKDVPMGGDLTDRPGRAEAPTFLVAALRDAKRGNLDLRWVLAILSLCPVEQPKIQSQ